MVRPDSSEPRRVLDEPPPSDATQSKQRIIHPPLLQDSRISLAPSTDTFAGLEIERILEQVLEQVLLATSATAAAIALQTGDDMVCRAAAGPNAPDVGVRLDLSSGLSGACVRTREMQHCEDTETDPRVNAAASRRLQVRSLLVVPLLEADQLLGLCEIFSPHPGAFGNRDLENLQTLAQVIVANLRDLCVAAPPVPAHVDCSPVADAPPDPQVESPVPPSATACEAENPIPDEPRLSWATPQPETNVSAAVLPAISSSLENELATQTEAPVFSASFPPKAAREKRAREWGTSLLTAGVIAMAVVLGWTVGRPRWQRLTSTLKKQPAITAPASASSDSGEARSVPPAAKSADSDAVETADESMRPGGAPLPKSNRDETVGGLVVYQNGKVIFRQTARSGPPGRASANFRAAQPDPETTEKVAAVFLSPQMASARLLQRIEPVYPESALQLHIQGEVELEALVGKDGSVQQLKLVSGDSQLAAAAADAVRQWRFQPYQSDGQDVEFSTRLTVEFRLH